MTKVTLPSTNVRGGMIYLIRNLVNQKGYVGQSILTLGKRWSLHKGDSRRGKEFPISRAIRKYGAENFSINVLQVANPEQLDELERMLIHELNTHVDNGFGYNADAGGRGNRGSFSEETRQKMAIIQHALWDSAERRKAWAATMKALHVANPDIRITQSAIRKAFLADHPEVRLKHAGDMRKSHLAHPERAKNHSIYMRERWRNPEVHQQLSASQRASYSTNLKRALDHSQTMKKVWDDPTFRGKLRESHKNRYSNPQERIRTAKACQSSGIIRSACGYKGVSKHGRGWTAKIKYHRRAIHLGTYATPEMAALAYNKKAIELFGPTAFQNQIR